MPRPNKSSAPLRTIASLLLMPVLKFLLRRGLPFTDLLLLAKEIYIDAAKQEIALTTSKINVSRISVLTGIDRREISKFTDPEQERPAEAPGILGRALVMWEQDKRYRGKDGKLKVLTTDGENSDFFKLIFRISKSINPATVLFEAIRSGSVEEVKGGAKLVRTVAALNEDQIDGYGLLAKDIDSLICAADENLNRIDELGNLHIRTEFDNIYVKDLPEIRAWILEQGRSFHHKLRDYLANFDKDTNPQTNVANVAGSRVIVSAFSHMPQQSSTN